jgi:hypothetical protein
MNRPARSANLQKMTRPNSIPQEIAPEDGTFFHRYAWVIIKNVFGSLLMLSAIVVGSVFPLPLGTPMFFIGFALVNFPGKRHLTSGALRGIPINLRSRSTRMWRLAISLLLPPGILWFLAHERHPVLHPTEMSLWELCGVYAGAIVAAWILMRMLLLGINALVSVLPRIRRRVRPWLRERGINLLPPRRKRVPKRIA